MKKIVIYSLILFLSLTNVARSARLQESRPLPTDSRLRVINYFPQGIHRYVGYYDYQASILLEEEEEVQTISMGDTTGWQIIPAGRRIFIKPVALNPDDANTNMLLITNKREYHFILEAREADPELGVNDPNLVFETTFVYSDSTDKDLQQFSSNDLPDLSNPEDYNFNYTMSGSELVAPIRAFDDGEFTYLQFEDVNADIPAIFNVDFQGNESLINFRVSGDYIVVERVSSVMTLRFGRDIVCLFNESRPFRNQKRKDKSFLKII